LNPPDRSSFGALGAKASIALGRVPWVWLGQRALLALTCAAALAGGYAVTQKRIEISIDGYRRPFHTHQSSVKNILEEAGIALYPEDRVFPPLESKIDANGKIVIQRALLVEIQADGQTYHLRTQSKTIREALDQAGLTLEPRDEVSLNGTAASPLSPLPVVAALLERALGISFFTSKEASAVASAPAKEARLWMGASAVPFSPALELSPQASPDLSPAGVTISITRAVPLHVHDGAAFSTIFSAAETVGEALERENIPVYLGDRVAPPLTAPLRPGMSVHIVRAKPVTILVDDRTWKTRTQSTSIYRLLQEEGVNLVGKDYTIPAITSTIASNLTVRVIRVKEEVITEQDPIPFKTVWQPDPNLELDLRRVAQEGQSGVRKRNIHIYYENGKELRRVLEKEWVDKAPVNKVIAFGTKVVLKEADTPDGKVQYWRAMRVVSTYYTAATSGKAKNHPSYGITRTGTRATKGIVAVDPQVIPLHTRLYVPGYGFGVAEDTGGWIRGMHIYVAYDEWDPNPRHLGWVTIYLLPPVSPSGKIAYILPDYPVERRR
jgi:uncharacterized protein YabE (DUF348 family)